MFDRSNLSILAYANGFSLWHYRTSDMKEEILDNGYFQGFKAFNKGDLVAVSSDDTYSDRFLAFVKNNDPVQLTLP